MTEDPFATAIDALDTALEVAEEVIRGLKSGVAAEVHLRPGDPSHWLVYGRLPTTKRRILHFRNGEQSSGLLTQSIEMRQEAARAVPRLVDALAAKRADLASQIQASADELDAYTGTLEENK